MVLNSVCLSLLLFVFIQKLLHVPHSITFNLVTVFSILSVDGNMQNKSNRRNKNNSNAKEGSFGVSTTGMGTSRHILVHILLSDSVAKGHVILPRSLRLYLRVNLHSWVYVQRYGVTPKKDIPSLKLSPCWFKLLGKDESFENNDLELLGSRKAIKSKSTPWKTDLVIGDETIDWSLHEEVLSALWLGCPEHEEKENRATERMESLVRTWLVAQLNEMALHVGGTDMRSLVLGKETLIHFEVDMSHKLRNPRKQFPSSGGSVEKKPGTEESSVELLFLLMATFEEASCGGQQDSYELSLTTENNSSDSFRGFELPHGKLEMGTPISLDSIRQRSCDRSFGSTISSLSWMEAAISDVLSRLQLLLSPNSVKLLSNFDLPLPGHVLIYGPPGSGKTLLAMAVAKYLEEHGDILAHIVFVNCSKLAIEKAQTIRQTLVGYISEALDHSPSLVILDDLDGVVSSSSESEGSQPSNSVTSLTEFLADIIDEYGDKNQSSCRIGPIAFMSSAQSLGSLPQSLTSSGRFDFHVQLPAPVASDRSAILKHGIHKRSLLCSDDIMSDIASKCDGYDAYDLEILLDRAVHAAVSRFLPSHATSVEHEKPSLIRDDFSQAMHDFTPVAMRGITKSGTEGGRTGWEDVGGLSDIRKAIEEMVELPAKFPNIFSQAPLRLRSNVLLYGPPGCGKTHIVGAAAAACSLRFISIKGPELLNKYIGASEQAVRDIFSKAAAASPCLLFFDEFDSIAPKRGHDNTGVTDRVVNQLLTELDGVETLTGVFVFAATSRPDLLDAALLRPGRLDRLLFCNFPSKQERLDILRVLSRKLPLAGDVDLDVVASMTEGFSGADLQALLSDAQLASVHELLESGEGGKPGKMPVIDGVLMKSVASTARPSVTEAEKHRLYGIYNQFLDSRKSVAAKTRDAKGKRATLA